MRANFHREVTMRALGAHFSPRAMAAVIAANLAQDSLQNLLGHPEIHFDNCAFDAARARIATLRDRVAASSDPAQQWRAFGALTHTAQDFYSHSNYVALWVERHGGYERTRPDEIDGLDETLLSSPELRTAYFRFWWDVLYHLPGRSIFRRLVPPRPDSHEAMHLDGPERGPAFPYSVVAAEQRTRFEYQQAVILLRDRAVDGAVARFHDKAP